MKSKLFILCLVFTLIFSCDENKKNNDDADVTMLPPDTINPLFQATVEATEEAIVNALVAGRDMAGNGGSVVRGIDHDGLVEVLRQHQRIVEP